MNDELTKALADLVEQTIQGGFKLPLYVVAVGCNGSIIAHKIDGLNVEVLCENIVPPGFVAPVNLYVTSTTGQSARVVLGGDGARRPVEFLN